MRTRVLTIAIFFLLIAWNGFCDNENPVGTITYLEGVSDISHNGASSAFANIKDPVYLGDRIRTKSYSKAEIEFGDKSILKLGPNTCVTIEEYKIDDKKTREHSRIKLTRGKVEAVVSKTGKPDTFVIETPNATGSVKGSDIFVFYQGGKTGVLVKEGKISVSNLSIPEKVVETMTGERVLVPFNAPPGEKQTFLDSEMKLHNRDVERFLLKKWLPKGEAQMNGVVTMSAGTARVYRKKSEDWQNTQQNDVLSEGDKIQTGEDGRIGIHLDNGNTVFLQSNTELAFETLRYDPSTGEYINTLESKYGKIKAIIEKRGKQSTFQIKTPLAICGPRGTIMYLDTTPTSTQAFYEGGQGLMISTITGQTAEIGAGQNSSADSSGAISIPIDTTNEQRNNLNQSWSGTEAIDGYSAPTASEGAFQQSLVSGGAQSVLPASEVGSDTMLASRPLDQVIFSETFSSATTASSVTTIYSGTLSYMVGGGFNAGTLDIALKSDGTWSGVITAGTINSNVSPSWSLTFKNYTTGDEVMVAGGNPGYATNTNGPIDWSATVQPANSFADSFDKQLSGSAIGQFAPSGAPNTYNGEMSGTWENYP
ncbi:MAG: hypothetical protein COS99_05660 [Candidatus Omnitrophica bacterium CG07_land_8_20_14_0_80_42_15]|uniref:FecR protein domain-containing protein n=1 Tax=Candidatus Aquitaenariimonas noxiae TaxID=1974741 RepID=A0A2J0L264_9BACT|nr:MAG: hypothetical protein COS99_05660 [Candidatus Omnitrophica bacterium CG07_land_8_20_14_0_80_42_15]